MSHWAPWNAPMVIGIPPVPCSSLLISAPTYIKINKCVSILILQSLNNLIQRLTGKEIEERSTQDIWLKRV